MTYGVRIDLNCGGDFLWKETALTVRAHAGGGQKGGIVLKSYPSSILRAAPGRCGTTMERHSDSRFVRTRL